MEFRTKIELPNRISPLTPLDQTFFVGSCFAENIGSEMAARKLPCTVNPFGVLYNPSSIRLCFQELTGEISPADFLFNSDSAWYSWLHDSSFCGNSREECLKELQDHLKETRSQLQQAHTLFLTLGTNRAYRLKESNLIVGNCHKQPGGLFEETTLDVQSCIKELETIIGLCLQENPGLRFVFTVSPYRYAKYGFHGSQLSKATLLLAADAVCCAHPDFCHYFPAYEIVLDELRDYRFYKEDMLHPSPQAVAYIWECFRQTFFSPETQEFVKEWETIKRALEHRPSRPNSKAYQDFLSKILLKLESIRKKYPNLALSYEFDWLSSRLK